MIMLCRRCSNMVTGFPRPPGVPESVARIEAAGCPRCYGTGADRFYDSQGRELDAATWLPVTRWWRRAVASPAVGLGLISKGEPMSFSIRNWLPSISLAGVWSWVVEKLDALRESTKALLSSKTAWFAVSVIAFFCFASGYIIGEIDTKAKGPQFSIVSTLPPLQPLVQPASDGVNWKETAKKSDEDLRATKADLQKARDALKLAQDRLKAKAAPAAAPVKAAAAAPAQPAFSPFPKD